MPVDRCICYEITFSEIKEIARERGLTSVEELQENRIACANCKLCIPFVKLMFETGETIFERRDRYRKK